MSDDKPDDKPIIELPLDPRDTSKHPYWMAMAERMRQVDPGPQDENLVIIAPRAVAAWPSRTWSPAERVTAGMMNTLRDQINELHTSVNPAWIDYVPVITSNSGAAVTITNPYTFKYMVFGKTLTITFYVGLNIAATPAVGFLQIPFPPGYTASNYTCNAFIDNNPANSSGMIHTRISETNLYLYRDTSGLPAWAAGAHIPCGTAIVPIL